MLNNLERGVWEAVILCHKFSTQTEALGFTSNDDNKISVCKSVGCCSDGHQRNALE